jgi:hypothetical protein
MKTVFPSLVDWLLELVRFVFRVGAYVVAFLGLTLIALAFALVRLIPGPVVCFVVAPFPRRVAPAVPETVDRSPPGA